MATVAQCFEQFMQSLELREGETREATRQEQYVFNALRERLRPKQSILSGSYGRNTAIRPLHDIDLFLIFPTSPYGGRSVTPAELLQEVKRALEDAFPGKQARLQNRSVNIEFSGTGIGFDVVPALEDPESPGVYRIADRRLSRWIQSNPHRHLRVCNEANDRSGKLLKPLIKAIKRWNQLQGKPVPSFLLEVMAYEGLHTFHPDSKASRYAQGVMHLFRFMGEHIQKQWDEPARLGPPVSAGVDANHLLQAEQRLAGATRKSSRALELERTGDMAGANVLWRELLGENYPLRVNHP